MVDHDAAAAGVDEFGSSTGWRCNHRGATRHGLEDRQTKALTSARKEPCVTTRVNVFELAVRRKVDVLHPLRWRSAAGFFAWPVGEEAQIRNLKSRNLNRFENNVRTLHRFYAIEKANSWNLGLGSRGSLEEILVDTVLNHVDREARHVLVNEIDEEL